MSASTEAAPAPYHGPASGLPVDSGGTSRPPCVCCGATEGDDAVFCPACLALWMASKERVRWAYWLGFLRPGPQASALLDFVERMQAERLNAGNGVAA